jgi:nucleotide-binding universal stress UspA family protein
MFQKVMVPLDGSPLAEQALGQAAAIARAAGAVLDLVLVHEPLPFAGFGDSPWEDYRWTQHETYLEAIAREMTSGASMPITRAVLAGDPADMICRRAWEIDADLVVMTTHGRTGLSRAWMGSIADRVLRHSSVPVLMLHPIAGKARETAARHLFKRILVALDGSAVAAGILPAASALARCGDARLVLLHVVQPVPQIIAAPMVGGMYPPAAYPPIVPDAAATSRLAAEAKRRLDEAARTVGDRQLECEAHVVVADHVAQAILDAALGHGADAIAMATRGRGASRLFMGSVADKVLRASRLPLLLLRPLAVGESAELMTASLTTSAVPAAIASRP